MSQKRNHKRSSSRIAVSLQVRWQSPEGEVALLHTQNISVGGMLLRSSRFIPPDREIELSIMLPGTDSELRATGQARFVGPAEEGFEIGMQILTMSHDDWQAWLSWCQRLSQPDAVAEQSTDGHARVRSNAHILLVSTALPVEMLAMLVANGYRVDVARDTLEAMSLLHQRHDFEIMICEVRRKDFDGRALCDLIKRDRGLRNLHVILLAEKESGRELLDGLDAGATYVMARPFTEDFLLSLITLCQRG